MTALRSLLFNIVFFGWSAILMLVFWVMMPLPRRVMLAATRGWMWTMMWLLKTLVGLTYEVRGREHLPDGPAVIACKHQSAWETGAFFRVMRDPAYVLKKELLAIPFYGWYLRKMKMITIDRKGGAAALRRMVRKTREAAAAGRSVVIFPEGTRSMPGRKGAYHPGVAAIYKDGSAPVVPAALNSGLFWGRRSLTKRPGVITLEFLPPLPRGLDRHAFMAELETRIETAAERLRAEAEAKFPPSSACARH